MDSTIDPTVTAFYAVTDSLNPDNVWEGALKEAFTAIYAAAPIPTDIDYALGEIDRLVAALTEAWDSICQEEK